MNKLKEDIYEFIEAVEEADIKKTKKLKKKLNRLEKFAGKITNEFDRREPINLNSYLNRHGILEEDAVLGNIK